MPLDTVCSGNNAGVNMEVTGSGDAALPYFISATVPIDPNPANDLSCNAAGLLVLSDISTIDTNTVDLNGDGAATPLEAHVIRTPDANVPNPDGIPTSINLIKELPGPGGGIYVSCEDVQDCVGQELGPILAGTCLTYTDANNKINVEIDPDPTNQVGCGTGPGGSGLFVGPPTTVVILPDNDGATDCVNVSVVEGPTGTFTLDASLVIDPASPTPAHCGPNGLSIDCVPSALTSETVTDGSPCVSTTGDGCATPYHVKLGLSPDPCNILVCHGNGLFANLPILFGPPDVSFDSPAAITAGPFNGNVNTVIDGPHCFTWTNTDPCRSAVLNLGTQMSIDQRLTGGTMRVILEFNLNGGGFGSSLNQFTSGPSNQGANFQANQQVALVPPGGTFSACVQIRLVTGAAVNAFISTLSYTGALLGRLV